MRVFIERLIDQNAEIELHKNDSVSDFIEHVMINDWLLAERFVLKDSSISIAVNIVRLYSALWTSSLTVQVRILAGNRHDIDFEFLAVERGWMSVQVRRVERDCLNEKYLEEQKIWL